MIGVGNPWTLNDFGQVFSDFPSSLDLFVKLLRSIAIIPTAIMEPVTSLAIHQQRIFFPVIQYGPI
jgi:hypothetical protein